MLQCKKRAGEELQWEDMVVASEAAGVIEAAVREAQVVHAAAVPEQEHQEIVMGDLAKTRIYWSQLPALIFILFFYAIFYIAILGGTRKQNAAYKYFRANPEKSSNAPMTLLYSDCPSCGASNAAQNEVCPYCGGLLKISDGNKKFVSS